jgi:cytochrome-b5 reductase
LQQSRQYATAATASKSNATLYVGIAAATGAGLYLYWRTKRYPEIQQILKERAAEASAKAKDAASSATDGAKDSIVEKAAAFTGGDQGFIDLKLESVENVNHNTKRFRFLLPEKDQVSGLQIACKSWKVANHQQKAFY